MQFSGEFIVCFRGLDLEQLACENGLYVPRFLGKDCFAALEEVTEERHRERPAGRSRPNSIWARAESQAARQDDNQGVSARLLSKGTLEGRGHEKKRMPPPSVLAFLLDG